jgi:glycerol-3-phosphate acyltransferase PlsY
VIPVLVLAAAFLLGALPFSAWIARAHGIDLREHGSGNLGATNVYRSVGWKQGVLALLLDAAKGTVAVLLARAAAGPGGALPAAAGFVAVLGHMLTPFAGFRGGKGVATGLGVFLGLAPLATAAGFLIWASVLALCGWVSLASGMAAVLLPGLVWITRDTLGERTGWVLALSAVTALLVIWRHRANWQRLSRGREQAIWERRPETPEGGAEPEAPVDGEAGDTEPGAEPSTAKRGDGEDATVGERAP